MQHFFHVSPGAKLLLVEFLLQLHVPPDIKTAWATKPHCPASSHMQTSAGDMQSCGAPSAKFLLALHTAWFTQRNQDLQHGLISSVSSSSSFSLHWFPSPASLRLLLTPRPSSLVSTKTIISSLYQELHLLLMPRLSSLVYINNLITCSYQDFHHSFTSRASSFAHTKNFMSSLHQELHLLFTSKT